MWQEKSFHGSKRAFSTVTSMSPYTKIKSPKHDIARFFIFSLKYGLNGKQDNTTYLSLVVPLRLILGSSRGPYLRCSPKCESALDDKACLWLMETWFWTKSVQKMSAHAQPEPEVNQQVFKMYFGPAIPGVRVNLSRKNDRGYFNEWLLLWHRLTKGFRHKIIFVLYSI